MGRHEKTTGSDAVPTQAARVDDSRRQRLRQADRRRFDTVRARYRPSRLWRVPEGSCAARVRHRELRTLVLALQQRERDRAGARALPRALQARLLALCGGRVDRLDSGSRAARGARRAASSRMTRHILLACLLAAALAL